MYYYLQSCHLYGKSTRRDMYLGLCFKTYFVRGDHWLDNIWSARHARARPCSGCPSRRSCRIVVKWSHFNIYIYIYIHIYVCVCKYIHVSAHVFCICSPLDALRGACGRKLCIGAGRGRGECAVYGTLFVRHSI